MTNTPDTNQGASAHSPTPTAHNKQADNHIVPAEAVSRIAFDYSQAVLGFIAKEMTKYEEAENGTEERGRWKSLFDCLDYVERMEFKKAYKITTVSQIEVNDLVATDKEAKND